MIDKERERERQREKQAPCRKPDVGLNPRTPGSRPGPKAGTKLLSHPGVPKECFLSGSEIPFNSFKLWHFSFLAFYFMF